MKTVVLSALLLISFFSSGQSVLTFEKDTMDVGQIIIEVDSLGREHKSTYRKMDLHFKNTGNEPLVINSVNGNGGAFAEFPKDPILPGKGGTIQVTVYKFRYDQYIQKDGSHSFCSAITFYGNYKGEQKSFYVKGSTKKVRK